VDVPSVMKGWYPAGVGSDVAEVLEILGAESVVPRGVSSLTKSFVD
jgi:hypothetical protein